MASKQKIILNQPQAIPLDRLRLRGMQSLADKGNAVEDIAAHFFVTPAVVR